MSFWNKLPIEVKTAVNLNVFKSYFEMLLKGVYGSGNILDISDDVLNRIESGSYLENKMRHNSFLKDNSSVARISFIDINWDFEFLYLAFN